MEWQIIFLILKAVRILRSCVTSLPNTRQVCAVIWSYAMYVLPRPGEEKLTACTAMSSFYPMILPNQISLELTPKSRVLANSIDRDESAILEQNFYSPYALSEIIER